MTAPLPPDELDQIEARAAATTEGPWEAEFRPIPGYPDYEVSDFGEVRTRLRKGNHLERKGQEWRLLKLRSNRGYKAVSIRASKEDSYRNRNVHSLVMLTFVGPRPAGKECAHLNGDPGDNRLTNLAYCTPKENNQHKRLHGTNGAGEKNAMAKLQGWQVAEVRYLSEKGVPQGRIATLFDIDQKQVSAITTGAVWQDEPARTDVPALVAEVRRQAEEIERLQGEVEGLHQDMAFAIAAEHCSCCEKCAPGVCGGALQGGTCDQTCFCEDDVEM